MTHSEATKKNFEDFNTMFKKIDREDCIPCFIADIVLDYVRGDGDESRMDDVSQWHEEGLYFEIRSIVYIPKNYGKVNFDARFERLSHHLEPEYEAGEASDSDDDFYDSDDNDDDNESFMKIVSLLNKETKNDFSRN